MSEEQLKAFIAKVQADTSLQEQIKAEGVDVVAIAKAAGFSITTVDLDSHSIELSDKELESVAGGGWECLAASGRFIFLRPSAEAAKFQTRCVE